MKSCSTIKFGSENTNAKQYWITDSTKKTSKLYSIIEDVRFLKKDHLDVTTTAIIIAKVRRKQLEWANNSLEKAIRAK